jgi:hypothetical protein
MLRLVGKKYSGEEEERFGPTLAAEHLASDDQVEVNAQTLRRWRLAEGLWSRARKRRLRRKRRERKEHLGELVQMDGSFHDCPIGPVRPAKFHENRSTSDKSELVTLTPLISARLDFATQGFRPWLEERGPARLLDEYGGRRQRR